MVRHIYMSLGFKRLMVLRHVSILRDHPQGVCLYLAKVTELFKRFYPLLN